MARSTRSSVSTRRTPRLGETRLRLFGCGRKPSRTDCHPHPCILEAVTKPAADGLVPARPGHKGLGGYRPSDPSRTETSVGFVTASQQGLVPHLSLARRNAERVRIEGVKCPRAESLPIPRPALRVRIGGEKCGTRCRIQGGERPIAIGASARCCCASGSRGSRSGLAWRRSPSW